MQRLEQYKKSAKIRGRQKICKDKSNTNKLCKDKTSAYKYAKTRAIQKICKDLGNADKINFKFAVWYQMCWFA